MPPCRSVAACSAHRMLWSVPGRCRRAHCTRPCARVGVMSSDFNDGGMLYYDRVGQGRENSELERVFAPGSREKHARVQS